MKQTKLTMLILTLLTGAALAAGCQSRDSRSAAVSEQSKTAAAQLDRAKADSEEAEQALQQAKQDYAFAQKAEFISAMRKDLAEIQEELDRLWARVDNSSGEARTEAKARLDEVREQWTEAKDRLDEAENATESNWDEVKDGFRETHDALKDSVKKTLQWLSDKIEP